MSAALIDLMQRPDLLQDPATVRDLGDVFGHLVLRLHALRLMLQAAWALIEVADLAISQMGIACELAEQVCGGVPMHGGAAGRYCSAVGWGAPPALQRLLERLHAQGGDEAASAPP